MWPEFLLDVKHKAKRSKLTWSCERSVHDIIVPGDLVTFNGQRRRSRQGEASNQFFAYSGC